MESNRVFKFKSIYDDPVFTAQRGKSWITAGVNNDLYQYIDKLIDFSPTHSGILNGTIMFGIGQGLVKPLDPKAEAFYLNGKTDDHDNDLGDITKNVIHDLVTYGHALLNVRYRKDRTGIGQIDYVDVRKALPDSEGEGFWISNDWKNFKKEANTPEFFPHFNPEQRDSEQLFHLVLPNARQETIPLPSYWSGRMHIECAYELVCCHLNRIRQGFFPSVVVQFRDTPNSPEQDENYKAIQSFYGGSGNSGKAAVLYGDGITITPFEPSDLPADFENLSDMVSREIRSAHRVTGEGGIFGLTAKGGGITFSTDQLLNEFTTYQSLVINGLQKVVCDVLNKLARVNGIPHDFQIERFKLFVEDEEPAQEGEGQPKEDVASTAMNGAQVSSLLEIIQSVSTGGLSKETARPLIHAAFPALPATTIDEMLAGVISTSNPIRP